MNQLTELLTRQSRQPVKEKVPTTALAKHMNGFFREQVKKREEDDKKKGYRPYFRVSEVGYEPRLVYLSVLGLMTWATTPQLWKVFENGTGVHERWERWVKEAGILVQKEAKVKWPDPKIYGRYDFKVKLDGQLWVGELKSCNSDTYSSLKEPKFEHVVQQVMYMLCEDIPRGYIIYENKDSQTPKYFETLLDGEGHVTVACPRQGYTHYDNLVDQVFSKLEYVTECIRDNQIPIPCIGCGPSCKRRDTCMPLEAEKEVRPYDSAV